MPSTEWILLLHAGTTLALVGLIWFVQVVHYPLYAEVGEEAFGRYAPLHNRRTSWVVGPLMLTEVFTAAVLCRTELPSAPVHLPLVGLLLLLVIWGSTAVLQIPCHRRLESGYHLPTIKRLVRGNWVRTAAWTARGVIALWLLASA